nr:MAG TPA: hypothetical protein [Caudoviricetes sp.]
MKYNLCSCKLTTQLIKTSEVQKISLLLGCQIHD